MFAACGVSTMCLLGSSDCIGRNLDARTLMGVPALLEDQWLPRDHAHRYAGHISSTLAYYLRRAVPKPDERMNEGCVPHPKKHTGHSIRSSGPQPALNSIFHFLAWGNPETGEHLIICLGMKQARARLLPLGRDIKVKSVCFTFATTHRMQGNLLKCSPILGFPNESFGPSLLCQFALANYHSESRFWETWIFR